MKIEMTHDTFKGSHFTVFSAVQPKMRKNWGSLRPVTKVKGSKKVHNRKWDKVELSRMLAVEKYD